MARLRVGLFGFGRTGRLVAHEVLNDPGTQLVWVVRRQPSLASDSVGTMLGSARDEGRLISADAFTSDPLAAGAVDVLIDFSSATAVHLYQALAGLGTRIVSAVAHYDEVALAALRRAAGDTAVLHSPNITVGINFLMIAARALRRLVPEADVAVLEEHFRQKPEVSGTAVRIARALELSPEDRVHSIRAGGIVGRHEIIFGLPNQTVRLVHESIHRAAFGRGALFAARWLRDRPPGLFSMEDAMRDAMVEAAMSAHG